MNDSRVDTYEHIREVQAGLNSCILLLLDRSHIHDRSKLGSPEREIFDEYTPKLKGSTYDSDEYKRFLAEMKPALDHHYAHNRHHPEYFGERGIKGMNLLDVLEMLIDWRAATKRHADGDIKRSIDLNQKRFGYSDELKAILHNTAAMLACYDIWHCFGCGAGGHTGNFCEQCGAGRKDYERRPQ